MFIKPKEQLKQNLNVKISNDAHIIINEYAYYTNYDLDLLLDKMIMYLLNDDDFIKSIKKKRFNKKILDILKKHYIDDDLKETYEETPFD